MPRTDSGHPLPTRMWPLFLALLIAVCGVLTACSDIDETKGWNAAPSGASGIDANTVVVPDISETAGEAAARIARALSKARTLEEARPLVIEVLARCGAPVRTASGDSRAQAVEPALDIWFFDFQTDNLALAQIEGQGFTMRQLAESMAESPSVDATVWADPLLLREFLGELVLAAEKVPSDPRSFGPLLLAALASQRDPAANLTDSSIVPTAYSMTYLEMLVFSLSVVRGVPTADGSSSKAADASLEELAGVALVRSVLERNPLDALMSAIATPANALDGNPCSWIESEWGKDVKDFANAGFGQGTDSLLGAAAEKLTKAAKESTQLGAKAGAKSVGYITALVSLVASRGGYSLTVTPEPSPAHYLAYDGGHGNKEVKFVAHVSSRPVADKELQSCLDWLGVELPDEKSAEDAVVKWMPLYGVKTYSAPEHAQVSLKGLNLTSTGGGGRLETKVSKGTARLYLDMSKEKNSKLEQKGRLKKDRIVVQAELFTENPGDGKILGMIFLGGTPDALKAWADKWFPKRVVATMPVEWHAAQRWRGELEHGNGLRFVFTSGESGLESVWTVKLEGELDIVELKFPVTGSAAVDLQRSDSQFTLVGKGSGTDDETTFEATITYTVGHVAIGGTAEDPTLELADLGIHIKVSMEGGGGSVTKTDKGKVSIPLEPYSE